MKDERSKYRPAESGAAILSRRSLLELAGMAVASAAIPAGAAIMQPIPGGDSNGQGVSPVMQKLSTYMSEASGRALPDEVTEKTKQHILDTLAAMISGSELTPGRAALQFAGAYGGKEVATVVASKIVCGPIEAALTNGVLAHADETDDSHAPSQSHPGCAVVPAALAAGERFGISGTHFLRAVTLGYDIGPRVTMTLGGQQFESESHWSTHSISPLFGAAAAAGCAAGLNVAQMRFLLGYTAHQSSGFFAWTRATENIQKAFHFGGMTARSGVTSALIVQSGWSGVEDIFSGKDNFFAAYNPHADPAGLTEKLGERYDITRTNIKKWPVGSPIQAALDALEIMRQKRSFQADQVQQVSVQLATHDKARMQDPATLRVRAKVKLIPSEELQRLMPLRVAIVELTLADGARVT